MTIATVHVWNQVLRKGRVETVDTELELPCGRSMIAHALDELGIEGAGENGGMKFTWVEPYGKRLYLSGHRHDINHIYELNHLAEGLAILSDADLARVEALCNRYLDDMIQNPAEQALLEVSFANAINMTHNVSDEIKVIEGLNNDRELGRYCVSHQLMPGFENVSDTVLRCLDYTLIGKIYNMLRDGSYHNGHYVYDLPAFADLKLPYDGKSLLIEPPAPPGPEEDAEQSGGIRMGGM